MDKRLCMIKSFMRNTLWLPFFFMLTQMFSQVPSTDPPISMVKNSVSIVDYSSIATGADQIDSWINLLEDKSVGVVVNATSVIDGGQHLVDALLERGVDLQKIFAPEHGFRTSADAGEKVESGVDPKTGLPIISLYGSHRKPTKEDYEGLDVIIFDIQDVGVRFYTYISTLEYVMTACNDYGKEFILLDRPNPNGFYVAGPVLDMEYQSFVGRHKIPVVYGLTMGEYAAMMIGEGWIESDNLDYTIIHCKNYNHKMTFDLPIKPSPNLPTFRSILLYPSLCLLEGTQVSVGRGTKHPFELYGHPSFTSFDFIFTPHSMPGASSPKYMGEKCYGKSLAEVPIGKIIADYRFSPEFLCDAYALWTSEAPFFLENHYIDLLAGTDDLRKCVLEGESAEEIESSWTDELMEYKEMRKGYLMY